MEDTKSFAKSLILTLRKPLQALWRRLWGTYKAKKFSSAQKHPPHRMAQNSFPSLTLDTQCEADFPTSSLVSEPNVCSGEDDYVPVNFIPDEVREMIRAWELAQQERLEHEEAPDAMSTEDVQVTQDHTSLQVLEPIRYITDAAPPKRFYRTFWRSVTRRALECDRESISAQKRAQTL